MRLPVEYAEVFDSDELSRTHDAFRATARLAGP